MSEPFFPPNPAMTGLLSEIGLTFKGMASRDRLLLLYLAQHAANADSEGMSVRCDCRLCAQTRVVLGMDDTTHDAEPIPERGPQG